MRTGATAGFEPAGGGFAEYVRVLSWCVGGMVRIPEAFPADEASMIEPLNTCLKGVRLAGIQGGDTVLVILDLAWNTNAHCINVGDRRR